MPGVHKSISLCIRVVRIGSGVWVTSDSKNIFFLLQSRLPSMPSPLKLVFQSNAAIGNLIRWFRPSPLFGLFFLPLNTLASWQVIMLSSWWTNVAFAHLWVNGTVLRNRTRTRSISPHGAGFLGKDQKCNYWLVILRSLLDVHTEMWDVQTDVWAWGTRKSMI